MSPTPTASVGPFRMIADDAGSLDVLVNVAGLSNAGTDTRIVDITEETWDAG